MSLDIFCTGIIFPSSSDHILQLCKDSSILVYLFRRSCTNEKYGHDDSFIPHLTFVCCGYRKHWSYTHTYFCIGLSSTRTINSLLLGIPLSTSAFKRRSRWGPNMSCNLRTWSSFAMSANSFWKVVKSLKSNKTTLISSKKTQISTG